MTLTTECNLSKKIETSEIFVVCNLLKEHIGLHEYTIKWRDNKP